MRMHNIYLAAALALIFLTPILRAQSNTPEHDTTAPQQQTKAMPTLSPESIQKRNAVIRKYLPEMFEEDIPLEKELLEDMAGNPINAVLMNYDDDGVLAEAIIIVDNERLVRMPVDDPEINEAFQDLRDDPLQSGTIVVDTSSLPRGDNAWGMSIAFGLLADGRYGRYYGKSTEQLAQELAGFDPQTGAHKPSAITLSLKEFFDGNTDESSIDPNRMNNEPPLRVFHETLEALQAKSEVKEVRILVHEWPEADEPGDDDMWIAAESVYVWANGVTPEQIHEWVETLDSEGVGEIANSDIPSGGPSIKPGDKVFAFTWD